MPGYENACQITGLTFGDALILNNLLIVSTYIHSRSEDISATVGKFFGGVPSHGVHLVEADKLPDWQAEACWVILLC